MSFSRSSFCSWAVMLMFFSLLPLTSASAQVIWQEDWETYTLGTMTDKEPETKGWDARLGFGSGQWSVLSDGTGNQYISRLNKANECCYWKGCRMLREESQNYDDVYFGFRFKFDNNFDFKSGGKLNGIIGGSDPSPGVPTDGSKGASVSMMWRKHPDGSNAIMHTYTYCENKNDQWGQHDTLKTANGTAIKFVRNKWYSIVIHLQMNTQNVADGRITVYLDGNIAMDRHDYLFRTGTGSWGWHINQLIYFFGGNGPGWAPNTDSYVYEDDWVLSQSLPTNLMNGNTIPQAPVSDLQVSSTSGTAPLQVNFDASGSSDPDGSISQYRWNFGDGSPVVFAGPTMSHTYSSPGTFSAQMTVIDNDGYSDKTIVPITVIDPNIPQEPVAVLTTSTTSGMGPLTVQFNGSASYDPDGTISYYRWNFGDGSPVIIGSANITHTFENPGVYESRLTVIDNDGLVSKVFRTITVLDPNIPQLPVSAFTMNYTSGLVPLEVEFDATGSSDPDGTIEVYRWNFGDGSPILINGPVVTHTFTTAGTFQIMLTVIDNDGNIDKEFKSIVVSNPIGGTCDPLPSGWSFSDVGAVGLSGTACYNSGTDEFSIVASGGDIWATNDQFGFVYQPLLGNGEVLLKLKTLDNTHEYAKIGVMLREDLSTDSKHAMLVMNQTKRAFQYRRKKGATTEPTSGSWIGPEYTHPTWLKIVRNGAVISAYLSEFGNFWDLVDTVHISMNPSIYAGIALTSHDNAQYNVATVNQVSFFQDNTTVFPVELVDFHAEGISSGVGLYWSTASESNNHYFSIERSDDGTVFEELIEVEGAGTTESETAYQSIDQDPWDGLIYYRLSQTDFNGVKKVLSTIEYLHGDDIEDRIAVFPNPTSTGRFRLTTIGIPEETSKRVRVLDAGGREILRSKMEGTEAEFLLPPNLPIGIYHVMIDYNSGMLGQTLIVK